MHITLYQPLYKHCKTCGCESEKDSMRCHNCNETDENLFVEVDKYENEKLYSGIMEELNTFKEELGD